MLAYSHDFMPPKLSVNVNKLALIRNSRNEGVPNISHLARCILDWGAFGITVHPRPDGRHVRYADVHDLSALLAEYPDREFNVEGYPTDSFMDLVMAVKPDQVTLVPDPPDALTSSFGWDVVVDYDRLSSVLGQLRSAGIRSSLFIDPVVPNCEVLSKLSPDRVELYTYDYAHQYTANREAAVAPYQMVAKAIDSIGIGLNAGHDLNLDNLNYFVTQIPILSEVSIGHALVCQALIDGLESTVQQYLTQLQ